MRPVEWYNQPATGLIRPAHERPVFSPAGKENSMQQPTGRILRPLNSTGLVDESAFLYRSNFLLFFGISSVLVVPAAMIAYLGGAIIGSSINLGDLGTAQGQMQPELGGLISSVLLMALVVPASLFSSAALTYAVAERYLEHDVTVVSAYKAILRLFGPLVGTVIVVGAVCMVGYMAVLLAIGLPLALAIGSNSPGAIAAVVIGLIPFVMILIALGLAVWVWIAMLPATCIIEKVWYFSAMRRAWKLARSRFWAILVVLLLSGFLQSIVAMPVSLVSELMGQSVILAAFYGLAYGLLTGVAEPVGRVPTVLLYFDARVRTEGFDLELLAQAMGQERETPAFAGPENP